MSEPLGEHFEAYPETELPEIAIRSYAPPESVERFRLAAAIANHLTKRPLFVVEEIESSDVPSTVDYRVVPFRVIGEWINDVPRDSSMLWRIKEVLETYPDNQ